MDLGPAFGAYKGAYNNLDVLIFGTDVYYTVRLYFVKKNP